LADHGVTDPFKQFQTGQEQTKALERRMLRYRSILEAETFAKLAEARSAEEGIKVFESTIKDEAERARVYLRLYGCDDGRWNLSAGMDEPLREALIPRISRAKLIQAMSDPANEPVMRGTVRCLFGDELWRKMAADLPKPVWLAAGKMGISNPRPEN